MSNARIKFCERIVRLIEARQKDGLSWEEIKRELLEKHDLSEHRIGLAVRDYEDSLRKHQEIVDELAQGVSELGFREVERSGQIFDIPYMPDLVYQIGVKKDDLVFMEYVHSIESLRRDLAGMNLFKAYHKWISFDLPRDHYLVLIRNALWNEKEVQAFYRSPLNKDVSMTLHATAYSWAKDLAKQLAEKYARDEQQ